MSGASEIAATMVSRTGLAITLAVEFTVRPVIDLISYHTYCDILSVFQKQAPLVFVNHPTNAFESGLSVFLQYKEGSSRQGKRSTKYKVPAMQWVGLRPSQLDDLDLPEEASIKVHVILIAISSPRS